MEEDYHFDFDEVFSPEDYLFFYQAILTEEKLDSEIEFLIKQTNLNKPRKILDLPCGYGRHANRLAKLGHRVTGVDLNAKFLEIAKNKANELDVEVEYVQGDMRQIQFKESFERVFALFTSIGYFNDEENKKIFRKIYESLGTGGIFCFDSHNRDSFLANSHPTSVVSRDGNYLVDEHSFNTLTGRCSTKRGVFRDGNQKEYRFSVRLYNPTEISQILGEIGFSSCKFYGGWDGSEINSTSKRMIVVAEK